MALVLGTAQWGGAYGITNQGTLMSAGSIACVASVATSNDINAVDISTGYGSALIRLKPWVHQFQVNLKIAFRNEEDPARQLASACSTLNASSFSQGLVHDWDELAPAERVTAAKFMERMRSEGVFGKVGVSVYSEFGVRTALDAFEDLGVAQVPMSVLDQRLVESQLLSQIIHRGSEVQARSIFLQGLLISDTRGQFNDHPDLERFDRTCSREGLTRIELALAFVKSCPLVTSALVGVTNASQLQKILEAWNGSSTHVGWHHLASRDLHLLDPRKWTTREIP